MYFDKDQVDPSLQNDQTEELSHTDKFIGIFSAPADTFNSISMFKLRAMDWLVPFLVLFIVAVLSFGIKMSNPEVKSQYLEEQLVKQQKALEKYPNISEEQKETQIEATRGFYKSTWFLPVSGAFILFFTSVFLFIPALVFYFFGKVAFKGNGSYQGALIASALPYYISLISLLLSAALTLAMKKFIPDLSLNSFMSHEGNYYLGMFYSMIDPVMIWASVVSVIGLTKLYRLKSYLPMGIVIAVFFILIKYLVYQG